MFRGSIPALVTPFRDEAFDEDAYRAFVEWQISEGSHGLVPCGTTGESATLEADEHYRIIEACVEQANGRVPVIAGCGSNDTQVAIQNMWAAKDRGADAALIVLPYYNRPNQDGLLAHFRKLASSCDLPIVVYNVPGRTVTDILPETLAELATLPNIVAHQGRLRQSRPGERAPPAVRRGFLSSSPAMTTWRWASTRWAGQGASRSPPMSRRGSARISRMPCLSGDWQTALDTQ